MRAVVTVSSICPFVAVAAVLALSCGRVHRDEDVGDGSRAQGGATAVGGSGSESGGVMSGRGGAAGGTEDRSGCTLHTPRVGDCDGGCTALVAFAARCPSFRDLEVAGMYSLVEHAGGADLFGFELEGTLTPLRRWPEPDLGRALAVAASDAPIVVHERADRALSIDPGSPPDDHVPLAMWPMDVRSDDGTLHLLGTTSSGLTLASMADSRTDYAVVAKDPSSGWGQLVAEASPPHVVHQVGEDSIWSFDGKESTRLPRS